MGEEFILQGLLKLFRLKQELSCSILVRSNQILLKSFFFSFLYSFLPLFSPSFFLSSLHSLPPLFFLLLFSPLPFLSTLPFLSPSSLSIPLFPFYPFLTLSRKVFLITHILFYFERHGRSGYLTITLFWKKSGNMYLLSRSITERLL